MLKLDFEIVIMGKYTRCVPILSVFYLKVHLIEKYKKNKNKNVVWKIPMKCRLHKFYTILYIPKLYIFVEIDEYGTR